MARYIDADALMEELKSLQMTITGIRCGKTYLNEIVREYQKSVLKIVHDTPTAEVVPKSEVDLYRKQVDELEDELASTYDKLENTKAEVAREIFEEIERTCVDTFGNFYIGATRGPFSELKKKYTEEQT